jgi:endonuclease YncB( thermonuclease family)
MHPTIETEIMKTRTADRQRKAHQDRLAQAAKQGRRGIWQHGTPRVLRRLRLRPVLRRLAI